MFGRKKSSDSMKCQDVRVRIREGVLLSIFDECDLYDADETGGRILGFYKFINERLEIEVADLIAPGPNASRSPTSFFQDGEYQERIFRKIETNRPDIEHLGNWHSHHVNGLATLSSGDTATYTRIVNHHNHNLNFFYALLVVAKNRSRNNAMRYKVKHFLLRRNDAAIYEIPKHAVAIDRSSPLLSISKEEATTNVRPAIPTAPLNTQSLSRIREMDQAVISDFYPDVKLLMAKKSQALYWRGKISLVDGRKFEVMVLENPETSISPYKITLMKEDIPLFQIAKDYSKRKFRSASKAIFSLEHDLNRELFDMRLNLKGPPDLQGDSKWIS